MNRLAEDGRGSNDLAEARNSRSDNLKSEKGWLQRQSNPGKRAKQDEEIAADIEVVFKTHRSRYGSPRIHQELRGNGRHIGRKRVERLMKRQGIQALQRRRFRCCPKQEEGNKISTNT
jgi:putative transposase